MPVGPDINGQAVADEPPERGAILPLFAILLVVLIGVTGFAVDLGWMYFKSIEVQHGADISSLAGVVYEPIQRAKAHDEALAAAKQNGFVDTTLGGPDSITVEDIVDNPAAVEHGSQLRVTIRHQIPTFFIRIFGINEVHITRTALAQYIEPLAMGSPDSTFGDDPSIGHEPGFWASVHGSYGPQSWGDRFAALCDGTGGFVNPSCPPTGEGRPSVGPGSGSATGGYVYGIEVFPGSSGLALEIFDGPYYHYEDEVPVPGEHAALYWTGDYGDPGSWGNPMAATWFMLYAPDATPLDTSDNTLLCSVRYAARDSRGDDYPWWDPAWVSFDEIDPSLLAQMWDNMATSADRTSCSGSLDAGAGIYPLRVMVEHSNGWWTTNKYSLRASTASGAPPNVYGLGDMSIFTNVDTGPPNPGISTFYLARVDDRYAGKTLVVELWDPGDVDERSESDTLTIFSNSGLSVSCDWVATDGGSGSSCTLPVGQSAGGQARFNDELITVTIPIPDTYTCSGSACWFRATYTYTGDLVHDTTTWSAFIAGNPIRLVE